jgi:hypothetical protein
MLSEPHRPTLNIDPSIASPSSNSTSNISSANFALPNFTQLISIKWDSHNYLMWLSQFLPVLRSHNLLRIVDGSEPCPLKFLHDDQGEAILNPEYTISTKKDQYLLSWINVTLSATVYGLNTSKQVWITLANRFASQSRSRVAHLKRQL